MTKRLNLKKLGSKKRYTFTGIYARIGYKTFKNHYTPTFMLSDVKLNNNKLLTNHAWFTYTKGFLRLGVLHYGDKVQFDARVGTYYKGYGPSEFQTLDYQLNYPTHIKLIKRIDHKKRPTFPLDKKKQTIIVGYAMKENKDFYIGNARPYSRFFVSLWDEWNIKQRIHSESRESRELDQMLLLMKKDKENYHRNKFDYHKTSILSFLRSHKWLCKQLNVLPLNNYFLMDSKSGLLISLRVLSNRFIKLHKYIVNNDELPKTYNHSLIWFVRHVPSSLHVLTLRQVMLYLEVHYLLVADVCNLPQKKCNRIINYVKCLTRLGSLSKRSIHINIIIGERLAMDHRSHYSKIHLLHGQYVELKHFLYNLKKNASIHNSKYDYLKLIHKLLKKSFSYLDYPDM